MIWGEVDKEGGHLYNCIKMLYEEAFHPEPVLTQGTEDALNLEVTSPLPTLGMNFLTPTVLFLINMTFLPLISEDEGSPPPKWETTVGTGGESSDLGSHLHQPACHCWGGCSPLGCLSPWSGCCNHHWGDHQFFRGTWDLNWGNNSPRSWDHQGSSTTTSLDCPWLSTPLALPADCLTASDWDSASDTKMESDSSNGSGREPGKTYPPPSDFQDVSQKPSLRVVYSDLVPVTRFFPTQLFISEGDQRCLTEFIQGWDIPMGLCPKHKNFKKVEEVPLPRITFASQRAVGCSSPIRSQPAAIFGWLIPIQGFTAPGWDKMAATPILIPFRTGKHSKRNLAVSMVLVWTHPMDMSIQGSSGAVPPMYGSTLAMVHSSWGFPIHRTNSVSVTGNWNWHPIIRVEGLAASHELLTELFTSSSQPISPVLIAVHSLTNLVINHPFRYILFSRNR